MAAENALRPSTARESTQSEGRHAATARSLRPHALRFGLFSAIGGAVFLMGFGLQAELTGGLHMLAVISYTIQAIVSVQASFLLNRWLTWRGRDTPFWISFWRFNVQKAVTILINLALYAGLLRLGMNYLLANVALTAVFTVVNYVAGDRFVFVPGKPAGQAPPEPAEPTVHGAGGDRHLPTVSVVIPCRDNERTIGEAVHSLLSQDYSRLQEIILVGSLADTTWAGLKDVTDPRLSMEELQPPPGVRDANFKRDAGIKMTSGDLIVLVDSDAVLPVGWISQAVAVLESTGVSCVTGGMRSVHDSFWGRYTDSTLIGAKTPRIAESYTVTNENFGRGRKPPITANTMFTRELYEACPIDPTWSHGSYEDYEWFWRVTSAGYAVRVSRDLYCWHHHRRGLRALIKEYRRSSRGCAYFIRAHLDSPLSKLRLRQLVILPLAAVAGIIAVTAAVVEGYNAAMAALLLTTATVICGSQIIRTRRLEGAAYPVVGFALGAVFTMGLITNLIRSGGHGGEPPPDVRPLAPDLTAHERKRTLRRNILQPVIAICAIQTILSMTLIWSNTAFNDEAEYLWAGHLEISHWIHGTTVPPTLTGVFSGSPTIYPPLGALADAVGGLMAARILSLVFMLTATVALYSVANRMFGQAVALFAAALWALSEAAIRLGAYATFDAMSVSLTAIAAWLIVQAAYRKHQLLIVVAAAAALGLANATAYSGLVIDPVVLAFALIVWLPRMGRRRTTFCLASLIGGLSLAFGLAITVSRSWTGILFTIILRGTRNGAVNSVATSSVGFILKNVWLYSGISIVLAAIGVTIALVAETRDKRLLLTLLGCALIVVPIAQIHAHTETSLDKHLAYGIWFAAIVSGYGCSKIVGTLTSSRAVTATACCGLALLVYPSANNWQAAWTKQHSWPNSKSFVTAFKPVVAQSHGIIFAANQAYIGKYYTPQGLNWSRWSSTIPAIPANISRTSREDYYPDLLKRADFGVIALFYTTTLNGLPRRMLLSTTKNITRRRLLEIIASNTGGTSPTWLPAFTLALERDTAYRLVAVGPYDSNTIVNSYAIWRKVNR
jgi:glycosyltransferase involved in cell wall biosynthesis/putative flippase GtrA